jgi:hypothetical protein
MNVINNFFRCFGSFYNKQEPAVLAPSFEEKLSYFSKKVFQSEFDLQNTLKSESFISRIFGYGKDKEIKEILSSSEKINDEVEEYCSGKNLSDRQVIQILEIKDRISAIDSLVKKRFKSWFNILAPFSFLSQKMSFSSKAVEIIKGDGHCFFRSTAHGLVDLYRKESFRNYLDNRLRLLEGNIDQMEVARDLKALIKLLPQGRKESDRLQQALRNLACSHNQKNHLIRAGGNPQTYFQNMRNGGAWGGGPEIDALREVLGIELCTSREEMALYRKDKPIIALQYSASHYNLITSSFS